MESAESDIIVQPSTSSSEKQRGHEFLKHLRGVARRKWEVLPLSQPYFLPLKQTHAYTHTEGSSGSSQVTVAMRSVFHGDHEVSSRQDSQVIGLCHGTGGWAASRALAEHVLQLSARCSDSQQHGVNVEVV